MDSLRIVDTHTHLCDAAFDQDREEVLKRAQEAGVVSVLLTGETLKDAEKNLLLAKRHPMLRPLAGLYPVHLDKNQAMDVEDFVRQHRDVWIGIGEVGLDFWKVQAPEEREVQQEIFVRFIGLSKELGLPLNVHTRSAGRHAIELLLDQEAEKVQMHAFDGKASTAMRAVEAGYFFSVPPSIVRSRQKQKLVHRLPLSCLLVETDSPVLGPAPGVRNEPKNVTIAIDAIADIKAVAREHVMEIVYENTVGLYGNAVV